MRQTQKKTRNELKAEDTTNHIFILPFLFVFYHITLFIDENKTTQKNYSHNFRNYTLVPTLSLSLSVTSSHLASIHKLFHSHSQCVCVCNIELCSIFSLSLSISSNRLFANYSLYVWHGILLISATFQLNLYHKRLFFSAVCVFFIGLHLCLLVMCVCVCMRCFTKRNHRQILMFYSTFGFQ